jgi:hypothetical protein
MFNETHMDEFKTFSESTKGILFVGTPHQGTEHISAAECFVKIHSMGQGNQQLTNELRANSEALQDQLSEYSAISDNYITKFLYETYATRLPRGPAQVVSSTVPISP